MDLRPRCVPLEHPWPRGKCFHGRSMSHGSPILALASVKRCSCLPQRPPEATQAGERGLLWGMDDLSPALRAQALLHGTSHLQTDVGQVMAVGHIFSSKRMEQPGLPQETQTFPGAP